MSFFADIFKGPTKPKTPAPVPAGTDTQAVQQAAADARKRAAYAKGSGSDKIASRLGNVG